MLKIDFSFLNSEKKICIATSGGIDSMALCHLLIQNNIPFSIAHCNFNLRGEESEGDELFVKLFAEINHIPIYIERFETEKLAKENKTSIEEEARNLRYDFFNRLTKEHSFDYILTAHHQDDNVETILMRLISGTGISGLVGIPRFRDPNFYRPLLNYSRKEIEAFVLENKIEFRTDSSNLELKYKRNKIRNEIIPLIEKINPSYRDAFSHIANLSKEYDAILNENLDKYKKDFLTTGQLDLNPFHNKEYFSTILNYILSDFNPNRIEINQLVKAKILTESRKFQMGSEWVEFKNGIISFINNKIYENVVYKNLDEVLNSKEFIAEHLDKHEEGLQYFDVDKLNFPLTLRKFRIGDKIKPLGMGGKSKKVSDIFKENKLTLNQKNNLVILEDSFNEIIAIIGIVCSHVTSFVIGSQAIISIKKKCK